MTPQSQNAFCLKLYDDGQVSSCLYRPAITLDLYRESYRARFLQQRPLDIKRQIEI